MMLDKTLSESIKEILIQEYLKKNPGVHESEVIARCKNGQMVVDHISKVMYDLNLKDRINFEEDSAENYSNLLQDFLSSDENERYKDCEHSVKKSKVIISMLFSAKYAKFGLVEKNEHTEFLVRQAKICSSACMDLIKTKSELLHFLEAEEPKFAYIKSLTQQFLHASVSQMKTQLSVFRREVTLGETYQSFVQALIEANIKKLKEALQTDAFLTIAKAYITLVGDEFQALDLKQIKPGNLEEMMQAYKGKLDERMEQIEKLSSAVEMIEKILELYEKSDEKQPSKNKSKEPSKKKGSGMAFMSRLFSRSK